MAAWRSASAPPTISMISVVMASWRARFITRVSLVISSSALSVADFIARCPVPVTGLSTMPPFAEKAEDNRRHFARLAELAGLMESDLAEANKSGELRPNRAHQISDAAKALSEGAAAAADGKEEPPDVGRSLAQLFSV